MARPKTQPAMNVSPYPVIPTVFRDNARFQKAQQSSISPDLPLPAATASWRPSERIVTSAVTPALSAAASALSTVSLMITSGH